MQVTFGIKKKGKLENTRDKVFCFASPALQRLLGAVSFCWWVYQILDVIIRLETRVTAQTPFHKILSCWDGQQSSSTGPLPPTPRHSWHSQPGSRAGRKGRIQSLRKRNGSDTHFHSLHDNGQCQKRKNEQNGKKD